MDRENGKISLKGDFRESIDIQVVIRSQTPTIRLYDTQHNTTLFDIMPQMSETVLQASNPYTLKDLEGSIYGDFSGGVCIQENGQCVIAMNAN